MQLQTKVQLEHSQLLQVQVVEQLHTSGKDLMTVVQTMHQWDQQLVHLTQHQL